MKKSKIKRVNCFVDLYPNKYPPGLYIGWDNDGVHHEDWYAAIIDEQGFGHHKFFRSKHQAVKWLRGKFPYSLSAGRSRVASPNELVYAFSKQGLVITIEEAAQLFIDCCIYQMRYLYYDGPKMEIEDLIMDSIDPYSAEQLLRDGYEFKLQLIEDSIAEKDFIKHEADETGSDVTDELASYDEIIMYYQKITDLYKAAMERNHIE